MATKKQKTFIKNVGEAVQKLAPEYGICVASPIIAQCIVESGWGESRLSNEYHNYFGIKAGTNWKGKSVNLKTNEEYTPGQITTITDAFRVYDSLEDGIRGYFDLIQLPRYANLKGVTDPSEYVGLIKADGYATDSQYVNTLLAVINENGLTKYDTLAQSAKPASKTKTASKASTNRTAKAYLDVFRLWIGYSEANGKYMEILNLYNSHKPLARGYAIQPYDEWCDCTVSAAAIKAGMVDLIGTEVGVENHVAIFKEKGIWIEDGTVVPEPGDIIVFNWDSNVQPNNGYSDHIGVVEYVKDGVIYTIEGNAGEVVMRRTYRVGQGCIRGFARPKYDIVYDIEQSEPVVEIIAVNEPIPSKAGTFAETGTPSKTPYCNARAITAVNVRTWAGVSYPNIRSYPILRKNDRVGICDYVPDSNGESWAYVQIAGSLYGFVKAMYLEKEVGK